MAMTMTEADAVSRLIHFVLNGEQRNGQAERSLPPIVARTAARDLEYLAERASKALKISIAGDAGTYAERLEVLAAPATGATAVADPGPLEQMRYAEWCKGQAAEASAARLVALTEINALHIEWGETDMDEENQLETWERVGRILRKVGI